MPSAEKMSLSSLVAAGESINNQEALKVDAQSLVENNAENLKPSAIPQILSPINAGLQIVQNKIRNLEKRKNKLESYKELEASGNNLNSEQKKAVAKYDEVIQHLEISKDFCKQFQTIATTASKEAKREARKSGFVRQQQESNKIREVLLIQETIAQLLDSTVRNDFLSGRNGACKVGVSELEFLNKFGKLMSPVRPAYSNETTFSNSVKSVAEHLCNVADGRPRPFADSGYTYDKIKDLLTKIQSCGYFEKNIKFVAEEKVAVECEVVAVDEQESENDDSEGKAEEQKDVVQQVQPAPTQSQIPTQAFAVTLPVVQSAPIPVVQPQQMQPQQQKQQSTGIAANNKNQPPTTVRAVEHQYFVQNQMKYVQQSPQQQQQQHHQVPIIPVQQQQQQHPNKPLAPNNPIHDVISSGNFFFLQDSELDAPAEVQLPKQQGGGKIVSLPTTVVQSPQLPPTIQQQQHQQQQQQPQSTISTQTFTNQNYHQQQQQQQPRENVVHSTQIYAPPGLNLQPQGVQPQQQQQQQTAHIPNYQSTQQHSTNQSQASSQIIPNQQQQQKQQIAGFATVQSSVNPQQPRPYPPILPPAHFQHMQQQQQQQQQQKTQAQPLPNEQQQQLQQNVQKLDSDSSSLQQQQQQSNMDSQQQTRSPPMQEQEKKRDDWSAQQQQPPQIDTWTNETANGAPSSTTNSNYNSTRPSSGYNRSSGGGGNRTSGGGNDRKYGNGGAQSNGGYRGNNGIQDNYRSSHQSRSNNNNNNNNSNGSGDTTSAPIDGTSNRSQPMGGTNGGGDTFYRNNGDRGYQNGGNGGNGGGRYDQSRGGYNSKPRNMDNAMNSRGNGGGPAPAGTQTQNRYGPRSGGSANAGQRETPRK